MMFVLVCSVNHFPVRRLLEKPSSQTLAWKECNQLEVWGWGTGDLQFGLGVASTQDYNKKAITQAPLVISASTALLVLSLTRELYIPG